MQKKYVPGARLYESININKTTKYLLDKKITIVDTTFNISYKPIKCCNLKKIGTFYIDTNINNDLGLFIFLIQLEESNLFYNYNLDSIKNNYNTILFFKFSQMKADAHLFQLSNRGGLFSWILTVPEVQKNESDARGNILS